MNVLSLEESVNCV